MSRPELVIMIGLPGAGKSSLYRSLLAGTHEWISKDRMKSKKHKEARQERLIREALSEGKSVAVDNMNLTRENRRALIHLGREFNAKIIAYYLPLSVKESFQRNAGPGRTEVPPVAIYTAAKKLQVPSLDEGFDELHIIDYNGSHERITA